jgi:hypothetical protein
MSIGYFEALTLTLTLSAINRDRDPLAGTPRPQHRSPASRDRPSRVGEVPGPPIFRSLPRAGVRKREDREG